MLAGGTTLAEQDKHVVNSAEDVEGWIKKLPELSIMGQVDSVFICGEEDHARGPQLWQRLASEVFKRYADYDGIIIPNSPHDMLYNAVALSFAFKNLNK